MDGKPTPASPVNTRIGFSECVAELARALHFGHKSSDVEENGVFQEQNFVLGRELESSSRKGPVIESGINTLNSLRSLILNFNTNLHVPGVTASVGPQIKKLLE